MFQMSQVLRFAHLQSEFSRRRRAKRCCIGDAESDGECLVGRGPRRTWTSQAVICPSYVARRMSEPNPPLCNVSIDPRVSEAKAPRTPRNDDRTHGITAPLCRRHRAEGALRPASDRRNRRPSTPTHTRLVGLRRSLASICDNYGIAESGRTHQRLFD
jgi:hypothetical protein